MSAHRTLVERRGPDPVPRMDIEEHLRLDRGEAASGYMNALIRAATQYVSDSTWLGLVEEEWLITLDAFPDAGVGLYPTPIRSVESVEYDDKSGQAVTLDPSEYRLVLKNASAKIEPVNDWPAGVEPGSVRVRYTTGFQPAEIPAQAVHAIRMLVAHWYAMREPVITGGRTYEVPMAVDALVEQIAVRRFL